MQSKQGSELHEAPPPSPTEQQERRAAWKGVAVAPRQMRGSFSQKGPQGSGVTVTFLGSPLPPPVSSCAMGLHCRPGDCLVLSAACTHLQSRAVAKSQLVQSNVSSRASHCFVIRHLGAAIGAGGTSTRICQAQPDPPARPGLSREPRGEQLCK